MEEEESSRVESSRFEWDEGIVVGFRSFVLFLSSEREERRQKEE